MNISSLTDGIQDVCLYSRWFPAAPDSQIILRRQKPSCSTLASPSEAFTHIIQVCLLVIWPDFVTPSPYLFRHPDTLFV